MSETFVHQPQEFSPKTLPLREQLIVSVLRFSALLMFLLQGSSATLRTCVVFMFIPGEPYEVILLEEQAHVTYTHNYTFTFKFIKFAHLIKSKPIGELHICMILLNKRRSYPNVGFLAC